MKRLPKYVAAETKEIPKSRGEQLREISRMLDSIEKEVHIGGKIPISTLDLLVEYARLNQFGQDILATMISASDKVQLSHDNLWLEPRAAEPDSQLLIEVKLSN